MTASSARRLRVVGAEPETGEIPVRVAFATHDLRTMDAHFAGARNLAVYDVTSEGYAFREAIRFEDSSNEDGVHADPDEDRITPRVAALDGCALVFVLAIGGPAAAKVVNQKIHPVKLPFAEPIEDVLGRVQTMLKTSPPPWLRKAMGRGRDADPDFLDEERG